MKKLIFIASLLLTSICNAGNLVFNQVLLFDACNSSFSQTVPTGKTWEITGISPEPNNSSGQWISPICYVLINGTLADLSDAGYSVPNNNGSAANVLHLWLPAGTVLSYNNTSAAGCGFISIIEYNITP